MGRAVLVSVLLLSTSSLACSHGARAPAPSSAGDAAATGSAAPAATGTAAPAATDAAPPADPFAALLDERARALLDAARPQLAAAGARPARIATIVRVVWQTVASDPVARIEAMAFLLPDGRLRWGALGTLRDADVLEAATDLAYPEGALAEGLRRPLATGQGACDLPMIPLADVATLPELARDDTFRNGYGRADACRIASDGAGAAWVMSLGWFGVIVEGADPATALFVTAPARVEHATITFEAPSVTPMPRGGRTPIVDGGGAPACTAAGDCFAIGERAALTGERALMAAAYARACDLGHGLACIHTASLEADAGAADRLRARAVTAFRTGCGGGGALDCAYLGIALETGQGAARDEAAAVKAYRKACDGGEPLGCFNLGGMLREGRGARKDLAAARVQYQRACDLGDAGGCDAAATLSR